MDLTSKRLRRQLQMSSMHARQLNKNATTMLERKLRAIDRRQQQNARVLARTHYAILRELDAYTQPGRRASEEQLGSSPRLPPLSGTARAKTGGMAGHLKQAADVDNPDITNGDVTDSEARQSAFGSSGKYTSEPCTVDVSCKNDATITIYPHDDHVKNATSPSSCRFSAFSSKCNCRYFPCSRPRTYHSLGVDKEYDFKHRFSLANAETTFTWPGTSTDSEPKTHPGSRASNPSFLQTHEATSPRGSNRRSSASAGEEEGEPSREKGHVSPRTSIPERLRGLKQLVKELREKNEQARPRDWAINYGDPVSRRLLRKPAIPVSEQVL
ncbi:hypothetical protein BaRGS_00023740 [Batillaria attramentaria]|uniref:Uncharacterized protein n=1 Tax=Batillaria attramentaria TaxID=370345 RepID=A0ABD0KD48_9CAEN